MPITPEEPPKLQVGSLVRQSYAFLGQNFGDFLRVAAIPAVGLYGAFYFMSWFPGAEVGFWVSYPIMTLFLSIFAVRWHRLYLLGGKRAPATLGLRMGKREWHFFAYTILASAAVLGVLVAVQVMAVFFWADESEPEPEALFSADILIYMLLAALAAIGLSLWRRLVLPAAVMNRMPGWRVWRFVASALLASLAVLGIVAVLIFVFDVYLMELELWQLELLYIVPIFGLVLLALLAAGAVFLRLSLALPAAAIDLSGSWYAHFAASWTRMKGNTLRLLAAAIIVGVPYMILSTVNEDLGILMAGETSAQVAVEVFNVMIMLPFEAVLITQISKAFEILGDWSPPLETNGEHPSDGELDAR